MPYGGGEYGVTEPWLPVPGGHWDGKCSASAETAGVLLSCRFPEVGLSDAAVKVG